MKDRHAAQLAAVPFRLVLVELGVDRLQEGSHEGDLVSGTDDRTLEVVVLDCNEEN